MSVASSSPSPLYAFICTDKPSSSELRAATRPAHISYLTDQATTFGGPTRETDDADVTGSFLIREANSTEQVEQFLSDEPYAKAGVFQTVRVRRWIRGMTSGTPLPPNMYAVWCIDRPDAKQLRSETRPQHLDWWRNCGRKGMIGPFPDEEGEGALGSLIVCDGDSVEEVTNWAKTDPYAVVGLFESVDVVAVKKVIEEGNVVS